jgi:hypothetical protein
MDSVKNVMAIILMMLFMFSYPDPMAEVDRIVVRCHVKKDGVPANESRAIAIGSINNLSHKEYAMKKCTVGIDAHKDSNVLALAFRDMKPSILHGKVSTDLNRTVDAIRKIQPKAQRR